MATRPYLVAAETACHPSITPAYAVVRAHGATRGDVADRHPKRASRWTLARVEDPGPSDAICGGLG